MSIIGRCFKERGNRMGRCVRWLVPVAVLFSGACATFQVPAPADDSALRERASSGSAEGFRVSTAMLSEEESRQRFGVDLAQKRIQPVWLEIENNSDRPVLFLPTGMDPEYFAPLEVAYAFFANDSADNVALGEHLQAQGFHSRGQIVPGETVSGFVYTNQSARSKLVDVDLLGREWSKSFSLIAPVPGVSEAGELAGLEASVYGASGVIEIESDTALRAALEKLPCCASGASDGAPSQPLNLILIGDAAQWRSGLQRRRYAYSEASPLYAFGRSQDAAGRKRSRWAPAQPNVVRVWLTPIRYRGLAVWAAQTSVPFGGRFAAAGADPALALPIDPDVDTARNDVVQDLMYSQHLAKLGFVKGSDPVLPSGQKNALDATGYHSDGLRAVLIFSGRSIPLSGIEFFDWETLADHTGGQLDTPTVE